MNDLTRNREEILKFTVGTKRRDVYVGKLIVHEFDASLGAIELSVPEHSIMLLNAPVVHACRWQGILQPRRSYVPGDMQFIPGGTVVSTIYASRPIHTTLIRFPHQAIQDAAEGQVDLSSDTLPFLKICKDQTLGMLGIVRMLALSKLQGKPIRPHTEDMIVGALIAAIADGFMNRSRWCDLGGYAGKNPQSIQRAIAFIQASLLSNISIPEIAKAATMSPFHFCRSFKAAMGVTPIRYLWQLRMERAQRMLTNRSLSLAEVAYSSGFGSQSHFTTAFKKATGVTPAAWRTGA